MANRNAKDVQRFVDNISKEVGEKAYDPTEYATKEYVDETFEKKADVVEVVANPTLEGTEPDLTGLEVDGTKYKVPQGGGGSGALYQHNIQFKEGYYTFILNTSETPFTASTFIDYINTNYPNNENAGLICNGLTDNDGFGYYAIPAKITGMNTEDHTIIILGWYATSGSNNDGEVFGISDIENSFMDTVVQIF